MRNLLLDRDTADRLLSGLVAPDDAPPGYAQVARLLRAFEQLPLSDRTRERATITAMAERITSRPSADPRPFRRVAARRPARLKLVAVAVGAMLVGTSGLAFAGSLPAPAQRIAHVVFGSVGLEVPAPDDRPTVEDVSADSEGPNASVGSPSATEHHAISPIPAHNEGRGSAHGAAVSSEASDGHGQAGQPHGQSGQPHGQSDLPHGQSDEPHGQSDEPHGQSDLPHGQSDEPHGQSDSGHPT